MVDGPRPFSGVRVVDATTTAAGALASMYLADFGADVVKVDISGEPDIPLEPLDVFANRNKRLTSISLTSVGGPGELRRLANRADVIVLDSPMSLIDRYGLDATTLCNSNSQLIHVWMPPHSPRGRGSALPGDDILLAAATGMADQQPATEDRPVVPVVPLLTYEHGALGAIAAAAGLFSRFRSGMGRSVTVSGLHAAAALNASFMGDLPGTVRAFGGPKTHVVGSPTARMYKCRDGKWIMVSCMSAAFFHRALDAMGMRQVMEIPGIDGDMRNLRDPERMHLVSEPLEARMLEMDRSDWLTVFERANVPIAPVMDREEWLQSETVAANKGLVTVEHSELGPVRLPGPLVALSDTPGRVERFADKTAETPVGEVWWGVAPYPPRNPSDVASQMTLPLDGLKVLDLGQFLAGPFVSDILGDFGASIIKIEQPAGDGYRMSPVSYASMNKGKRNLSLDLKDRRAVEALLHLATQSDLLVDNARAGVPERLGVHYDALRAVNPRLVRCTVMGWGGGPLNETPCFDQLLQARSGLMLAQGGDGDPVLIATPPQDVGAATLGAFGALVALIARESTGVGQEVRSTLTLASLMQQAGEMTRFAGSPSPAKGGTDFPGPSPSRRLYECSDGWVALSAQSRGATPLEGEVALREALGLPPEADEAGLEQLQQHFAAHSVEAILDDLAAASIPATRVVGRDEIFAEPSLAENCFFTSVSDSEHGPLTVIRGYGDWGLDESPGRSWSHARGEDAADILRDAGLSADLAPTGAGSA